MTGVKVNHLTEEQLEKIANAVGDSFADYEYAPGEKGANTLFRTREEMQRVFKACCVAAYKSGCLYATSERGEGYIGISTKEHGMTAGAALGFIRDLLRALGIRGLIHFIKAKSGGRATKSYEHELKKRKEPFMKLDMLVVLQEFQGHGHMRRLMDMLYELADEKHLSIIFDTDAKLKAEKYVHLGTTLVKERKYGNGMIMYDLYRPAQ